MDQLLAVCVCVCVCVCVVSQARPSRQAACRESLARETGVCVCVCVCVCVVPHKGKGKEDIAMSHPPPCCLILENLSGKCNC